MIYFEFILSELIFESVQSWSTKPSICGGQSILCFAWPFSSRFLFLLWKLVYTFYDFDWDCVAFCQRLLNGLDHLALDNYFAERSLHWVSSTLFVWSWWQFVDGYGWLALIPQVSRKFLQVDLVQLKSTCSCNFAISVLECLYFDLRDIAGVEWARGLMKCKGWGLLCTLGLIRIDWGDNIAWVRAVVDALEDGIFAHRVGHRRWFGV